MMLAVGIFRSYIVFIDDGAFRIDVRGPGLGGSDALGYGQFSGLGSQGFFEIYAV